MSYLEKAIQVAERLNKEKEKKLAEEKAKSLDVCMNSTILSFRDEIIKIGRWRPSPETRQAEAEIEKSQHEILEGRGELIDFSEACQKWKAAGTRER